MIKIKSKKLVIKKEPKRIIREEIRFGIFKRKVRKGYEALLMDFRESTKGRIKIDDLIAQLKTIKSFVESKLKGKYTDIFISTEYASDWEGNGDYYFYVELGRLETDEEYNTRIEEKRQSNKRWAAQSLKSDAKRYLELKNKFEPKK